MPKETTNDFSHLRLAAIVAESVVVFGAVVAANGEIAFLSLQGVNVALAVAILLRRAARSVPPSPATFEPNIRFGLRATLVVSSICCAFLAVTRWHEPKFAIPFLLWLLSAALFVAALQGQRSGFFGALAYHQFLGAFLFAGPIAAYHINGRAWYDYRVSGWNPPLSVDEEGTVWRGDYDPKFTPPASWPIVGGVLHAMCVYSIGIVVCPPVAPLVALTSGILLLRYRRFNTRRQLRLTFALWSAALCPLLYLIVWGDKVLSWIAD